MRAVSTMARRLASGVSRPHWSPVERMKRPPSAASIDGLLAGVNHILHAAVEHDVGGVEVALEGELVAVEALSLF